MLKKLKILKSRKSFAEVSRGLKGIFERTWSWMKGQNYRKEKKMQKGLAVGRYCTDFEASNSKSKVLKAMKVTLAERGQVFLRFNAKIISVA